MATWSHSRIESYRSCPRKYHLKYVQRVRLPEEPETLAQFLGSRAHEALEKLYGVVRDGGRPTLEQLLCWFRDAWAREWHEGVTPIDERTPEQHREQAEGWLRDYWNRHAPFTGSRTIDLERRIEFPLDGDGRVRMQGFIDRIARKPDGTWQVHDYKTERRLKTQQEKDRDPQLAYYEIGLRRMWPDDVREVELVWHYLAFDTSITSRRTAGQLEAVRAGALATVAEIESRGRAAEAFPTRETGLCGYCEYQQVCPVRRHRFAVDALPPARFAHESGVALVGRWANLDVLRRKLQEDLETVQAGIDEVKAAIADYAAAHDLEVVTGEEREATVRRSEKAQFPRRSDREEAGEARALEAQLRASRWWPEASEVSRFALERLWQRRATLDAALRALLEEFARPVERVDVRLRNRKG